MDTESTMRYFRGELPRADTVMGCRYNPIGQRAEFRVFAPGADEVHLLGDFNGFDKEKPIVMRPAKSGFFEAAIKQLKAFDRYIYRIHTRKGWFERPDPYAVAGDTEGYSLVFDRALIQTNAEAAEVFGARRKVLRHSMSIYAMHPYSWRRHADGRTYFYDTLGKELGAYAADMGFTHVELIGVTGERKGKHETYTVGGYFQPDPRLGSPEDFCRMIDDLHRKGLGVFITLPMGGFLSGGRGLFDFDGTHPFSGILPESNGILPFDSARGEVRTFLSAVLEYWPRVFGVDGVRLTGLESVFSHEGGETESAGAAFYRERIRALKELYPGIKWMVDDASGNQQLLQTDEQGLGFDIVFDPRLSEEVLYRLTSAKKRLAQNEGTPPAIFNDSEGYIWPITFDCETGFTRPLMARLSGTESARGAVFRAYYMFMFAHPGKKHMFMGNEFGQVADWDGVDMPEWQLLKHLPNESVREFVRTLNAFCTEPGAPLCAKATTKWMADAGGGVYAMVRTRLKKQMLCLFNFNDREIKNFRVGAERFPYKTVLISDLHGYKQKGKTYRPVGRPHAGSDQYVEVTLPPFSGMYLYAEFIE